MKFQENLVKNDKIFEDISNSLKNEPKEINEFIIISKYLEGEYMFFLKVSHLVSQYSK